MQDKVGKEDLLLLVTFLAGVECEIVLVMGK